MWKFPWINITWNTSKCSEHLNLDIHLRNIILWWMKLVNLTKKFFPDKKFAGKMSHVCLEYIYIFTYRFIWIQPGLSDTLLVLAEPWLQKKVLCLENNHGWRKTFIFTFWTFSAKKWQIFHKFQTEAAISGIIMIL